MTRPPATPAPIAAGGMASEPPTSSGITQKRRRPRPGTATSASPSANTMNVRWVPMVGMSSSAARNVPTREPTVEIAYRLPIVRPVSFRFWMLRRLT